MDLLEVKGLTKRYKNFTLQDITFSLPAGVYEALRIVIGEGEGQNWWCVLFPPLCLVTEEGEPVDLDALSFESDVLALLKAAFPGWFQ